MRKKAAALVLTALAAMLALAACGSSGSGGQEVLFDADDGTVLRARLLSGKGVTSVLLIHDFDSSQSAWKGLAETLVNRRITVFAYDMRGHGASPGRKETGTSDLDATAALRFMRNALMLEQVFIIGEGAGAVTALRVASREQVLGVVSVSAPESFRGTSAANAVSRIDAPKLFVASEGDEDSANTARGFQTRSREPSELALFPGDERGAVLLAKNRDARDRVLDFLDEHRPG